MSPEGALEKSVDSGHTWMPFEVGNGTKFHAISVSRSEIWAGGDDGALFHSSDGGAHWTRVRPTANGAMLVDGIVRIRFVDAQHGLVTTQNGEIWTTADGGATWERR
ncbi:MAG TPA: YCF48-related protein [Candidatus Acidoferrales bacterium]|nr:YCF48-related protein [Candidatus Acidoferrales bacterium]